MYVLAVVTQILACGGRKGGGDAAARAPEAAAPSVDAPSPAAEAAAPDGTAPDPRGPDGGSPDAPATDAASPDLLLADATSRDAALDRKRACEVACGFLLEPCADYSPLQLAGCVASCLTKSDAQLRCTAYVLDSRTLSLDQQCVAVAACLRP
jgi:hypothetical protein